MTEKEDTLWAPPTPSLSLNSSLVELVVIEYCYSHYSYKTICASKSHF